MRRRRSTERGIRAASCGRVPCQRRGGQRALEHGANPRTRDGKYRGTPAGWAAYAGHLATAISFSKRTSTSSMRSTSIAPIASATSSIATPARSIDRSRPTRRAGRAHANSGGRRRDVHAARVGDRARKAERRPSLDRARRRRTNRGRPSTRRAHRHIPAVGVLGPSGARQGESPDARPRGAADPCGGSVARPRQPLHRDRLRRSSGGRAHPCGTSRGGAPARGARGWTANPVSRLHPLHARADARAGAGDRAAAARARRGSERLLYGG